MKRLPVPGNINGQSSNGRTLPEAVTHPTERGTSPAIYITATLCVIQGILSFLVYSLDMFTRWSGTVIYVNDVLLTIIAAESIFGVPVGLVTLALGTLYLKFCFRRMNRGYRVAFIASNILSIVAVFEVLAMWLQNNWHTVGQVHAGIGNFILAAFLSLVAINAFMFLRRSTNRQRLIVLVVLPAGTLLIADFFFALSYPQREFALRFLLKAIAVVAASVGVLAYCGYILRRISGAGVSIAGLVGLAAAEAIATAFVAVLILFSPPSVRQLERLDHQRLNDLHKIQFDVTTYWQENGKLPASLDLIPTFSPHSTAPVPLDPVTRQPYEYLRTGDFSFDVCASFAVPDDWRPGGRDEAEWGFGPKSNTNWSHPAGTTCFKRTIDPNVLRRDDVAR